MQKILEEKLNRIVKGKEFLLGFEVQKEGIYALEITATAKSWWQNFSSLRSFFKDGDLTLKIDGIEFPKKSGKKGLFDSEVAFNGNNLKELRKTDLFLIKFQKGEHHLQFIADQSPKIEIIRIYQLQENETQLSYLPKDNYPIQEGNRRQWLAVILVNLGLKSLKITASAKEGKEFLLFKRDDSDLKLIIDGEIQKNEEPKSHQYWYWCGRILKGKEKTFEKELNFKQDIHYIELWADRMPEVKNIKIGLEKISSLAKAKVIWQEVNLRKEPNSTSEILAKLSQRETVEILEKAIEGEAYLKEKGDCTNIWHKVRYQSKEGFIFSKALEIEKEDEETIKKLIKEIAQELNVDADLMIRIAKEESAFSPYAVSEDKAKGIFQLTPITIKQIKEAGGIYGYPLENPFDVYQNIQGGIRYFKWLYEVYYKNEPQRLEKTLIGWNWRLEHTPKGERIDWSKIPNEVQEFVEKILRGKEGKIKIKAVLVIAGVLIVFIIGFYLKEVFSQKGKMIKEEFKREETQQEPQKIELFSDLDSDGTIEKLLFEEIQPEKEVLVIRKVNIYLQKDKKSQLLFKNMDGALEEIKIVDLNQDGKKEVIITLAPSNRVLTQVFTFENNQLKLIPIIPEDSVQGFFNRHGVNIIDLEGDGIKEIFVPQRWYYTKECQGEGEIYKYYDGRLVKFLEVKESLDWCKNFQG